MLHILIESFALNVQTGVSGSKYVQKQAGPVCEEMKDPANMEAW